MILEIYIDVDYVIDKKFTYGCCICLLKPKNRKKKKKHYKVRCYSKKA